MKKAISLALSLALLCSLALPAAAAETADLRLTLVTQTVKNTLSIPDTFDSFSGNLSEGEASPLWYLSWGSDDASIQVTADETGKIFSYDLNEAGFDAYQGDSGTSLPKTSREDAQSVAAAFLAKVLDATTEKAVFPQNSPDLRVYGSAYRFYGDILLNGLPAPYSFYVTVRADDGKVTSFNRRDQYLQMLNGVPSATPKAAKAPAGDSLKSTLSLRLEYVLDAGSKTATLRYLPDNGDVYFVDGQTGKLTNLTELYAEMQRGGSEKEKYDGLSGVGETAAAPAAPVAGQGLSDVEQAGIAKLEGVRSKEELDKNLRARAALGLTSYALSRISYQQNTETNDISAQLVYTKQSGSDTWRRSATVDAKTGALLSLYSSSPYDANDKAAITESDAKAKAEAFLTQQNPDLFAKTELYVAATLSSGESEYNFFYVQKEDKYFFPQNHFNIGIDASDGSIRSFDFLFDDAIVFDSAENLISADAALAAWFGTYQVTLGYLSVPQKLDPSSPDAKPLLDLGHSYYYGLQLAYSLERESDYLGVDAKTGEAVQPETSAPSSIAYSDLDGVWGRDRVQALASFGIGWIGDTLQPQKALTQLDLIALLASAQGNRYELDTAEKTNELYRWAYDVGLLAKSERQDSKELSRIELVKFLLDSGDYGDVAKLSGIFKCAFTDQAQIPAEFYGYAALAQGMGIVTGDSKGNFSPTRTATRLEAMLMLYQFMNR